jgi:hypothetical protein
VSKSAADIDPDPIFSDAHPGHVGNDDEDAVAKPPILEGDIKLEDTPAAAEVNAPAEVLLSSDYLQKAALSMVIIAVIVLIIRRRRKSRESQLDEKSDAL